MMFFKTIIFCLLSIFQYQIYGAVLERNTELYLIERKESDFFVLVLEENDENLGPRTGWISFDHKNPNMQFFTSKVEEDNLAFLTTDIDQAFYLKLAKNTDFREDNAYFQKIKKQRPDWNNKLFLGLDRYVPISNNGVVFASTDLSKACPIHPQKKDGSPCAKRRAIELPDDVLYEIRKAAEKIKISPALVASIIHHETNFQLFLENLHEKNKCERGDCSDYGWGRGFAQLGKTDAHIYQIDWYHDRPHFPLCNDQGFVTKECFRSVNKYCEKNYAHKRLKPYFCPSAAIKAVADKLSRLLPESSNIYLRKGEDQLYTIDIAPYLIKDKQTEIRNRVAAYNRRPARVLNSYAQFIQQNQKAPEEFGEAWSTLRQGNNTPTRNIGYGMLTREFINRCYVWNVAGLCGEIPESSLFHSYQKQFELLEN